MTVARYIPLSLSQAQAPGPSWWRRKAIHASFVIVVTISVYALFEYAIRITGDADGDYLGNPGHAGDPIDTSLDAAYLPFKPRKPIISKALKPGTELPTSCLDAHIAQGALCYNFAEPRLDVLWTWVNGSDILHRDAKIRIENSFPADAPYRPTSSWKKERQFRDHDELRFSMRSVLKNFRQSAGQFHLVTADFAVPDTEPNANISADFRLGQIPQWLDVDHQDWKDGRVRLSTIHHAEIFDPYRDTTFNSYGIESQFGHLPEHVSENFIYMNDDFFFLGPLTARTFYTSAYGLVLRMQSDLLVSPIQYRNNVRGEWRSLAASNVLLSNRFGVRHRPYVTHEAKGSSVSILHEISQIWSAELADVATHPFRETKSGESDFSMMFLMVHFVVERWREALLWSWVVAKHGGLDDSWNEVATDAAWKDLGGGEDRSLDVIVKSVQRASVNPDRVSANLRASGLKQSDRTTYVYSSQDGYPYIGFASTLKNKWPKYEGNIPAAQRVECGIKFSKCFKDEDGNAFTRASDLFANLAFVNIRCGDCVIQALVKASGELGLEAFLPPPSRVLPSLAGKISHADGEVPHLPLVDNWIDGEYALREVMGSARDVGIRDWTLRLLQRYRFVIGDTPSHFAMLTGTSDTVSMIRKLKKDSAVLLCVNDDIARDDDKVRKLLGDWAREYWPEPAAWEH